MLFSDDTILEHIQKGYYIEKNYANSHPEIPCLQTFLRFFSMSHSSFQKTKYYFTNRHTNVKYLVLNSKLYSLKTLNKQLPDDISLKKQDIFPVSPSNMETSLFSTCKKVERIERYYFDELKTVYIDYNMIDVYSTSGSYFMIQQLQTSICKTTDAIDILKDTLKKLDDFMGNNI